MKFSGKKLSVALAIILVAGAGVFYYRSAASKKAAVQYQTPEEASNIYVRFAMETYDKIQKNYWGKSDQYNLPKIFELSLEKAAGKPGIANPSDRATTAGAVAAALKLATSTEGQKNLVTQAVAIALYNLEPIGRDSLMSQTQVTNLRNEVSNINPNKDLYGDLGLAKGASVSEVDKAYEDRAAELKKATSTEAKKELAQAAYAHSVLSDADKKNLYDDKQIEPTLFSHVIGRTLYLNLSIVSPTSLWEFANAVDKASTTAGIDSMILDFRGNIGGAMDFLPAFLGLFIGPDQYAFDLYSQGNKNVVRTTQQKLPGLDRFKEVAILTDGDTQSTAELTTDAFKRYHLGKSVGLKTKGWGTIENTYPLDTVIDPNEKYTLLLVNSLTVRGDNQPIEGNGVLPDDDISQPGWQNRLANLFDSQSLISALKQTAPVAPLKQ